MNNRIKQLREALGKNQEKFGEELGLSRNYISLVENGQRKLSEQSFKVLCSLYDVNEDWIRYGTGKMFVEKTKDEQIAEMLGEIQKSGEDGFKRRLVSALADLDDSGWNMLEKLIDSIAKKSGRR